MGDSPLHIAVGIIRDASGRVLLSQRRAGTHGAGDWEFPGGKVEPGESVRAALGRELREELGVDVEAAQPLIAITHRYPERSVLLDTWAVDTFSGDVAPCEGQRLAWVPTDELGDWPLMAADGPIVHAVRLPHLYLLTGEFEGPDDALRRLGKALEGGVRMVRLRADALSDAAYASLARAMVDRCRERGALLLLDRDADMLDAVGADGLHLTGAALRACKKRPLSADRLLGASCHDARELSLACELGADFAVLSPLAATASHPGASPLGWDRFREWVSGVNIPVYALGGLGPSDCAAARVAGGQGIAAIRSLWPS